MLQDCNERNGEKVNSNSKKNIQIPKLYLRPKSADAKCYPTSKESQELVCDRETHSRSALDATENERIRKVKIPHAAANRKVDF